MSLSLAMDCMDKKDLPRGEIRPNEASWAYERGFERLLHFFFFRNFVAEFLRIFFSIILPCDFFSTITSFAKTMDLINLKINARFKRWLLVVIQRDNGAIAIELYFDTTPNVSQTLRWSVYRSFWCFFCWQKILLQVLSLQQFHTPHIVQSTLFWDLYGIVILVRRQSLKPVTIY